jgi:GTPase SAR1 family protein
MTAKSIIKHDDQNCQGPPKNIILVGTKLDLVDQDESLRAVDYEEALHLGKKLNLSSVIETSSKNTEILGSIDDINDVFSICALNCFDMSIDK